MENQTVQSSLPEYQEPEKKKISTRVIKIVLGIFAIIVVIQLVMGARTLLAPIPEIPKLQPITGGKIGLIAAKTEYRVGEDIEVLIKVSTGGHTTDGTDLVLSYDPKVLSASSSAFFTKGTIYQEYPIIEHDFQEGVIRVSGVTSLQQEGFNGIGSLGTLKFRAQSPGQTVLTIEYRPNETQESNIVESRNAKDILDQAFNLNLRITEN